MSEHPGSGREHRLADDTVPVLRLSARLPIWTLEGAYPGRGTSPEEDPGNVYPQLVQDWLRRLGMCPMRETDRWVARSGMTHVFVLTSDVGLNGHVVHGVYSDPPSRRILDQAQKYTQWLTGYGGTSVQRLELNSPLPCGGECTRPAKGGTWSDCYCYRNRCNDRADTT